MGIFIRHVFGLGVWLLGRMSSQVGLFLIKVPWFPDVHLDEGSSKRHGPYVHAVQLYREAPTGVT